MKRFSSLAVLLLLLSGLLGSCGGGNASGNYPGSYPVYYPGYSGTFLSWTDGSNSSHPFTLVRVDGMTGNVTKIGTDNTDYIPAMAYAPDGTLYGVSTELLIIDPTNGSTQLIGRFDYGTDIGILMHGAAFSPTGTLYVVENAVGADDRVFTVDLTDATLTYVGTPSAIIWDLEFASNGTLYGAFGSLYTLNPSNMTTITNIGSTGTYLLPLTFNSGGTLFGLDDQSTKISSLNLLNGWASPVIKPGSGGLVSLVVEDSTAPAAGINMNKVAPKQGPSSPKSLEKLQSMEQEIVSARRRMKKGSAK